LAGQDLIAVAGSRPNTLSVARLCGLSAARQRNVIRQWLIGRGLPVPTQRQLERVLIDVGGARWDGVPMVAWEGAEVRRYRDDLYAMAPRADHDPTMVLHWDAIQPLHIPHLGIMLEPSMLEAFGIASTGDEPEITVRFRRGGERCRPRGRRHHHDLKKLFQEAGVPPWERDRIPLIYVGERLIAAVGHWACE
jgi:tRNA(Ile)-lysidine synthase